MSTLRRRRRKKHVKEIYLEVFCLVMQKWTEFFLDCSHEHEVDQGWGYRQEDCSTTGQLSGILA